MAAEPTTRSVPLLSRATARLRADGELVKRYRAGDDAAFAVLHDRYRARVLAICLGVLSSPHDAEDAAQETFAAAARQLREGIVPAQPSAWLAAIARNRAIDYQRTRRTAAAEPDRRLPAPGGGPPEALERRARLAEVVAAMRALPERQRSALALREVGGCSYDEIAHLLDIDTDAVRGLIARARLGMRAAAATPINVDCGEVRARLAAEPDGRRHSATMRRHMRECASCRGLRRSMRADARTLRSLAPGGGALSFLGLVAGARAGRAAVVGAIVAIKGGLGGAGAGIVAACVALACGVGAVELANGPGKPDSTDARPVPAEVEQPAREAADTHDAAATAEAVRPVAVRTTTRPRGRRRSGRRVRRAATNRGPSSNAGRRGTARRGDDDHGDEERREESSGRSGSDDGERSGRSETSGSGESGSDDGSREGSDDGMSGELSSGTSGESGTGGESATSGESSGMGPTGGDSSGSGESSGSGDGSLSGDSSGSDDRSGED